MSKLLLFSKVVSFLTLSNNSTISRTAIQQINLGSGEVIAPIDAAMVFLHLATFEPDAALRYLVAEDPMTQLLLSAAWSHVQISTAIKFGGGTLSMDSTEGLCKGRVIFCMLNKTYNWLLFGQQLHLFIEGKVFRFLDKLAK